ncbi:CBS domain-containing protein [Alicyclobacillus sacchari]|uniref:CBS domain-containing protein n=1 Tax=Alicyclobacillus sacchari TaxID=392010 RepID=UPI0024E17BAF|nr:CBS domain-containing protein [Alicyclobacillus sacchari]
MTTDVTCCCGTDSIQKAAQAMKNQNCGSIPVCDNKRVIGMITDRDIVLKAVARGKIDTRVEDCMTNTVVTATPDMDAHEAADLMAQHQIRRLPIVNAQGELCGIVSIGDLATVDIHINEAAMPSAKFRLARKHKIVSYIDTLSMEGLRPLFCWPEWPKIQKGCPRKVQPFCVCYSISVEPSANFCCAYATSLRVMLPPMEPFSNDETNPQ